MLDEAGNEIETPFNASQVYNQPTLKNLEVKFKQNEVLQEHFTLGFKDQKGGAISSTWPAYNQRNRGLYALTEFTP